MRQGYGKLQARAQTIANKGEKTIGTLVRTGEVSAAAFAAGMVQGKYGVVEVVGVPADLAVGAGLHLAGFLGLGGKMSSHLHSLGDGALAAYFVTLGKGTGLSMKEGSKKQDKLSGADGKRLSEGELRDLAADPQS